METKDEKEEEEEVFLYYSVHLFVKYINEWTEHRLKYANVTICE